MGLTRHRFLGFFGLDVLPPDRPRFKLGEPKFRFEFGDLNRFQFSESLFGSLSLDQEPPADTLGRVVQIVRLFR